MRRSMLLASLVLPLAACASLLGDFEVAKSGPTTPDSGKPDSGGLSDAAVGAEASGEDAEAGTDPLAGQPVPVAVATNHFGTCASVTYPGAKVVTYCWGAAMAPAIPPYLGVTPDDLGKNGFFRPHVGGSAVPLTFTRLFGGSGGWFLGKGNEQQGQLVAYAWGANLVGQTSAPASAAALPLQVRLGGSSLNLSAGAVGPFHGCLTEGTGNLYCWGQNDTCEVTTGLTASCNGIPPGSDVVPVTDKTSIVGGTPRTFFAVAAGANHTCAASHQQGGGGGTSVIHCWGDNTFVQSGQKGGITTHVDDARIVDDVPSGAKDTVDIAAGENHTCALVGRNLYCWGRNGDRQALPSATNGNNVPPTQLDVGGGFGGSLSKLSLSGNTSCVVASGPNASNSRIICWGVGPLGRAPKDMDAKAAEVADIEGITDLAVSDKHACAIARLQADPAGAPLGLFCWGDNSSKQVDPNEATSPVDRPHRVLFPTEL